MDVSAPLRARDSSLRLVAHSSKQLRLCIRRIVFHRDLILMLLAFPLLWETRSSFLPARHHRQAPEEGVEIFSED